MIWSLTTADPALDVFLAAALPNLVEALGIAKWSSQLASDLLYIDIPAYFLCFRDLLEPFSCFPPDQRFSLPGGLVLLKAAQCQQIPRLGRMSFSIKL